MVGLLIAGTMRAVPRQVTKVINLGGQQQGGSVGTPVSSSCSDSPKIKIGDDEGRVAAGGRQKCRRRWQLLEETRLMRSQGTAHALLDFVGCFLVFFPQTSSLISEMGMNLRNYKPLVGHHRNGGSFESRAVRLRRCSAFRYLCSCKGRKLL